MMDVSQGSPERFGYSWDRFAELTPEQEFQFELWTTPIPLTTGWRAMRFLDAGCGMGRNSYWPMKHGAESGVAIDLDDRSLARARNNLTDFPGVVVRKASIYDIPYENEFDIVFSIGVIHHLEYPEKAIEQLVRAAKPGGRILVWVYGYENLEFYVNILNPVRKYLFSRMPLSLVRMIAFMPTALLWVMLKVGLRPIEYMKMLSKFPFMHLHHIVFDQMLPKTASYWTKDQALDLLKSPALGDITIHWINECSWSITGIKRQV